MIQSPFPKSGHVEVTWPFKTDLGIAQELVKNLSLQIAKNLSCPLLPAGRPFAPLLVIAPGALEATLSFGFVTMALWLFFLQAHSALLRQSKVNCQCWVKVKELRADSAGRREDRLAALCPTWHRRRALAVVAANQAASYQIKSLDPALRGHSWKKGQAYLLPCYPYNQWLC